jgi:hypothetical protein
MTGWIDDFGSYLSFYLLSLSLRFREKKGVISELSERERR